MCHQVPTHWWEWAFCNCGSICTTVSIWDLVGPKTTLFQLWNSWWWWGELYTKYVCLRTLSAPTWWWLKDMHQHVCFVLCLFVSCLRLRCLLVHRDKLKWNGAYPPHKLVFAACKRILWKLFLITYVSWLLLLTSWLSLPVATKNATETHDADLANILTGSSCWFQKYDRNSEHRFCRIVSSDLWVDNSLYTYLHLLPTWSDEVNG